VASYGAGDGEPGASDESDELDELVARPVGQARLAWRRWRHTRPFWGGLLIIFAGAEMLLSEQAPLPVIVHIGVQGLAGYLVPIVLVLCGLLIWLSPLQQTFYSVLAVLLALGSWITSNLGGFFVGLLLGVIGGALAYAWSRDEGPPPPVHIRWRRPRITPSEGLSLILGDEAADAPYEDAEQPQHEPPARADDGASSGGASTGSALLAISAVPVVLLAMVVTSSPAASLTPCPCVTTSPPSPMPTGTNTTVKLVTSLQHCRRHYLRWVPSQERARGIDVPGELPRHFPPIRTAFPLAGISVATYLAAGRYRADAYDVARGRRGAGDSCGAGLRADRVGRTAGAVARDRASPPGVGRGARSADTAS
jgi:hypothetical protein